MCEGFAIQLTLLQQEITIVPKERLTRDSDSLFFISEEHLPTRMATWPRGYKHPRKEWEFCPLQQGNPVHPSITASRVSKLRPSLAMSTMSSQALIKEMGRPDSQDEVRISIVSRNGSQASKKSRFTKPRHSVLMEYERNRPLPPLPLNVSRSSSSIRSSLSFRRKRENEKLSIEVKGKEALSIAARRQSSSGITTSPKVAIPTPLQLPPTPVKTDQLEATTPGLGDAEVITIKLDDYPSPPAIPEQFQDFVPAASNSTNIADIQRKSSISTHDRGFKLEDSGHGGLDIKEERANIPMKLKLEIPSQASASSSPYISTMSVDEDIYASSPPKERPLSRSIPAEEIIFTPGGFEERRYVLPPTNRSEIQQSAAKYAAEVSPPYYTKFPPPPHPEHTKKPSTSSSGSQVTNSTFGHSHRRDEESQITDYDDYAVDAYENENGNDSCASSIISDSSYPESEYSMVEGHGGRIVSLPVPPEASASSTQVPDDQREIGAIHDDNEDISPLTVNPPTLPCGMATDVGLALSGVDFVVLEHKVNAYEPLISPVVEEEESDLPPFTDDRKVARKSANTSRLSARLPMLPGSPQSSLRILGGNRSSSCSNLLSVPELSISAEPSSSESKGKERALSWDLLYPPSTRNRVARSVTPTPSMFRNQDGDSAGKLGVIMEENARPRTAPAADNMRSMSFFEDDDMDEHENGEEFARDAGTAACAFKIGIESIESV
ncbi:hypothetical protein AA313_de0208642 [Arthrobotrys entomopaga]|nr:hypothetical protein AA313_de0208642 [Arthrobotrys entomopaga]